MTRMPGRPGVARASRICFSSAGAIGGRPRRLPSLLAWPRLRFEGKPQCHIIPIAKESNEIAMSVGCMLSRVRTGMSNNEVTCAIPASRVSELIERLRAARVADKAVAAYAAEDSRRFARQQ